MALWIYRKIHALQKKLVGLSDTYNCFRINNNNNNSNNNINNNNNNNIKNLHTVSKDGESVYQRMLFTLAERCDGKLFTDDLLRL